MVMQKAEIDVFAFYLPQFHPCDANDQFWQVGFTDWVTTNAARPLYDGHNQPNIPGPLGYYDLADPRVIKHQAELAKEYGFRGFAIYHYWFAPDSRALEKPINLIRENTEIDIDYFISWVNADWTKSWVGESRVRIREQTYTEELFKLILADACEHFLDRGYYKINGKPLFYIHMPSKFDVSAFMRIGESMAAEKGFPGICWVAPEHHTDKKQREKFDFLIGYPPGDFSLSFAKRFSVIHWASKKIFKNLVTKDWLYTLFNVFDYRKYVDEYLKQIKSKCRKDKKYIPTMLTSWDNTPRYGRRGVVLKDSSPDHNQFFFKEILSCCANNDKKFLMVKAWNEWAEGNYLEPDQYYGVRRLEALRKAKFGA